MAIRGPDGERERIAARTVIWAAGVTASELAAALAEAAGVEVDRAGRVTVGPDLTLPGHPEVFALGDMVRVQGSDGETAPLPGVAPVAMQEGRYAAARSETACAGRSRRRSATSTRATSPRSAARSAVADIKGLHFSGFPAWVVWLAVHLFYLIGFQNRLLVLFRWTISFLTHGRGARLIGGRH